MPKNPHAVAIGSFDSRSVVEKRADALIEILMETRASREEAIYAALLHREFHLILAEEKIERLKKRIKNAQKS